jgi:hypothetical protein
MYTYLHSSSSHIELLRELFAELGIRLRITLENVFQDLELSAGCSFAMFDFIRDIRIERSKID